MSTVDPSFDLRLASLSEGEALRWSDPLLDLLRTAGDPYADAVIADHIAALHGVDSGSAGHAAVGTLFTTLIRTRDFAPAEISDHITKYFETAGWPAWADAEKVRAGEKLFQRIGPVVLMLLYFKALPECYVCWRGAEVLLRTGRMTEGPASPDVVREIGTAPTAKLERRVLETAQFIIDVMAPGGLVPNGKGVQAARKVRLIHAAIRHFIHADARRHPGVVATTMGPHIGWDFETLGEPINQEDYLGTLMAFSVAMLEGAHMLGLDIDDDERDAYIHCWNLVGHFVGLRDEILPRDFADARHLMDRILERHTGASDAGRLLATALMDLATDMLPKPMRNLPHFMVRHLTNETTVKALDIKLPEDLLSVLTGVGVELAFAGLDRLEHRSRELAAIVEEITPLFVEAIIKQHNDGKEVEFELPSSLRGQWLKESAWGTRSVLSDAGSANRTSPDATPDESDDMAGVTDVTRNAADPTRTESAAHAMHVTLRTDPAAGGALASLWEAIVRAVRRVFGS